MAVRQDFRTVAGSDEPRVNGGKMMIYGRPTLMWEGAPSPEEYYKTAFGYSEVHSIDVSDYEGATFVHDLNDPKLPEHLVGQYDYVSMGGSAEHVFNIGTALRKSAELLRPGGTVFCSGPANNWLDHGFYQLCPTLKFDFYQQNGFDLLWSRATLYRPGESTFRRIIPLYPAEAQNLNYIPAKLSHILAAKKPETSTTDVVPLQSIYRAKHAGESLKWRFSPFAPYDIVDGKNAPSPLTKFKLDNSKFHPMDGAWAHVFRDDRFTPSMKGRPFRSGALVFENGTLLPWIVSETGMVAERNGSFAHFGGRIHISTTDGSDPRKNGRTYELCFPQLFKGMEPYDLG